MTEDQFLTRIIDAAQLLGWHVHHCRPARTADGRWRTPVQGNPGFPDLVLARNGVVIIAEVKTDRGRLTEDQRGWLDALHDTARVWRPAGWEQILIELGGA